VTPWNRVSSHPTLREAVEESGIAFPKGRDKRALVPGCGQVSHSHGSSDRFLPCRVVM